MTVSQTDYIEHERISVWKFLQRMDSLCLQHDEAVHGVKIGIIRKWNRISEKTHLMIHKWFAFRSLTQSRIIYWDRYIDGHIRYWYWDSKPIHLWHCVKQLGVIFEKRSDYLPIFYPAQKLLSSCTMDWAR